MDDFQKLYLRLLQSHKVKQCEYGHPPQLFGNKYVTLKNRKILVRHILDRSDLGILVSSVKEREKWHDIASVKAVCLDEKEISLPQDIEQLNNWLIENWAQVEHLFEDANREKTKARIEVLGK